MSSSGGLLSEHLPAGVRLLDAPTTAFGTVLGATGGEALADLQTMSRTELEMERLRLVDDRRGLALPIVLMSVGGGVLLVGLAMMTSYSFFGVGVVTSLLAAGAVTVGVILLVVAISHNARVSSRIRAIDQRIRSMEHDPSGGGDTPPPPPPPPPAGVWRDVPVVPQVVVATF
jgi:hypothetical protein